MKKFAIIGVAGFVAKRHIEAIKATGNKLVAACDISDSVGLLDQYFDDVAFFTSYERFERFLHKIAQKEKGIDYLVVCTPNHLHDTHIRLGLSVGADVICEKPLTINPWNLDALSTAETQSNAKIFSILQMRLHPVFQELKSVIEDSADVDVKLTYVTKRGLWYHTSWKGDAFKSGGICVNIGIHFFDLLLDIFGNPHSHKLYQLTHDRASGFLRFSNAKVSWYLSINQQSLDEHIDFGDKHALRAIEIGDNKFDFTSGFEDLHKESYKQILSGKGFTISDARASISLVHDIRTSELVPVDEDAHLLTSIPVLPHPFKHRRS